MRRIIMKCNHIPDCIDSLNRIGCSICNCWDIKSEKIIDQRKKKDRRKYNHFNDITNLGG